MPSSTRIAPLLALAALACTPKPSFDPANPAVGPGAMVGNGDAVTNGTFPGGADVIPAARDTDPPDPTRPPNCDGDCRTWCAAQDFDNPVNAGLCESLWGVGLDSRPIDPDEACRRLFVDLHGRIPSGAEADATCAGGLGAAAKKLIDDPRFTLMQQRRWADKLLYANEVTSLQGIFDADALVAKLAQGKVPFDLFASVIAAHPVVTRRYANAGDTTEAVFRLFLGRPPFENERADMARLYSQWHRGYYDHPLLGVRLPDSYLAYPCLGEDGAPDPTKAGQCTSVLWGYNEIALLPDLRAARQSDSGNLSSLITWQGLLNANEWQTLQVPGRILAKDVTFWEHLAGAVLEEYLGYDLNKLVPDVRDALVRYTLEHQGDLRAVVFAVVTSAAYLQSHAGESANAYRWTFGPHKQLEAEAWIESLSTLAGTGTNLCDHRLPQADQLLESGSLSGYRVLANSRWKIDEDGRIDRAATELARTLGGCPENVIGGRFKVVSILTTATQLGYANEVCNPTLDEELDGAPLAKLLPTGVTGTRALDDTLASDLGTHLYRALLGRSPTASELDDVKAAGTGCITERCNAEEFARPVCFALLSGAEALFY